MRALRELRAGDVWLATLVLAGIVVLAVLKSTPAGGGGDTFDVSDYRSGGYAAWYELLRREGVTVERFERRPAYLDASIDTLIAASPVMPAGENVRGPADRAALARWVHDGGRLIALGAGSGFPLPYARPGAVRTSYGRGEVVSIRDAHPFDNALLARADNARLAYVLAKPRRPGGVVAFDEALHGAVADRAWWQVLDVPTRVALGCIAIAVLIALGGSALRLGPAVTLRAGREPASDEFVAAVASLYERSRSRRAAIALLASGARHASGDAVTQLRALAERQTPSDRDLIASAALARAIREGR
jgi:Domain of unknown function (DUF4350)